MLICMSCNVH